MELKLLQEIVNAKRDYFLKGNTKNIDLRIKWVKLIRDNLIRYKDDFYEAFRADFNKPAFEVTTTELGQVIHECNYLLKHGKHELKPEKVKTGTVNLGSKGFIMKEPYGVVLVVSPWNYPLNLSLTPAIGALFCGNTVLLKLSSNTKNVNKVIEKVLEPIPKEAFSILYTDRSSKESIFDIQYDYIFFTGSKEVGREVAQKAGKFLTPFTVELGGKSPVIVDKDAKIKLAAKRIVWGKFINAGQTCIAPDFVYVHKDVKEQFVKECLYWINKFYFKKGQISNDFPFIINDRQVQRLVSLINEDKVLNKNIRFGRLISPVLMDATWDDKVMQEEIFGPILPILTFSTLDEVITTLNKKDKPLALYYFGETEDRAMKVLNNVSFGGGAINNTIMHITVEGFPFGGVAQSGIGEYHGKYTIRTFTNAKPILVQSKKERKVKFPPYTTMKRLLSEFIFKIF